MSGLRAPLIRTVMILSFAGLIAFSILRVKNIETTSAQASQENMRKQAFSEKAPNCLPHRDASQVDQSLPPCQSVTAIVVAKPQKPDGDPLRSYAHPRVKLLLTLRFSDGSFQTVGSIYKDMWNTLRVGDQVSVTVWGTQVEDVKANGYSCPIIYMTGWDGGIIRLLPWLALVLLCSYCISRLWAVGRRQTDVV